MSGEITSQQPVRRESVEVDRSTLRLAAGAVAEAYQIDYFREYPKGFSKPSDGERLQIWHKAEIDSPEFSQQIAALGSRIQGAQHATDLVGASVPGYFHEVTNPITRELLANFLIIRLGVSEKPFAARKLVAALGVREKDAIKEILRQNEPNLRLLSTTDVVEAYLRGSLTIPPPNNQEVE